MFYKITKNLAIYLLSGISMLGLASCGGGGGGAGVATGPGVASGIFLDAPVQGLSYTSGATTGTTGADGSFSYEIGQPVTFALGGVIIGTATPTSTTTAVITPVDMVAGATNTTNAAVQQIGVFLQTLDSDGNPANGIQISAATVLAAAGQTVDFTNPASVTAVMNVVAPGVVAVTAAQAQVNMDNARLAAMAGHLTGVFSGTCTSGPVTGDWTSDISSLGVVSGTARDLTVPAAPVALTITGSITAMGTVSASASGLTGNSTWTGTATLGGGISGTWNQAAVGPLPACSGTFSGSKSINNVATFAGNYQGSYTGTDSGTWTGTVAANGTITGTGTSRLVGAFTVAGTVASNGSATMAQSQGGVSTGAVFSASFNPFGGVSGTWVNGPASGTISGFRN